MTEIARSYRFTQTTSPDDDGLTLEGYAAVFDEPARINNWEGNFTETVKRGAFTRAVRANPKPKVQFDHGQHPMLGSIPIAALQSMREDERGLFVSARLHDNWLTEPVRDAIKSGAIDGMSFRFHVPEGGDTWDDTGETRTLIDVDVPELGPVVFPAYAGTEVSVRSQQLAEALEDDTVRHDLAIALLLETRMTEEPAEDRADAYLEAEPEEEPRTEDPETTDAPNESAPADPVADSEETPVEDETRDDPEPVSAPYPNNLAKSRATELQVRAALVAQRSQIETD